MTIFPRLSLTSLCLAMCATASATVVISWGPAGDIVNSSQNLANAQEGVRTISFSSFVTPAVGAGYYPNNAGKTPEFYGATYSTQTINSIVSSDQGNNAWRINESGTDQIFSAKNGAASEPTLIVDLYSGYSWTKSEFLAGADTAPNVTLNSISATVGDNGSGSSTNYRFFVELNGTDWYVSDTSFGEGNNTLSNPASQTWLDYDPETDFSDVSGSVASLSASDFDNLTGVGIFTHSASASAGNRFVQTHFTQFEVDASFVPEPSTYALITGLVVAGLLVLRRRR